MSAEAITSVFNDGYIADAYDSFRRDPSSVDESWRQFFRFAEGLAGTSPSARKTAGSLHAAAAAAALLDAIRAYGHLAVRIDPLESDPPGSPELRPDSHGVTEAELATIPGTALGMRDATAADATARLRTLYSSTMGFEFEHLGSFDERKWLRDAVEGGSYHQDLTADEKTAILFRLTEVDALERFLGRAYQGYKRFSIEGSDALVVMLDEIIALSALGGAREVAMAMAHRGRINVLTHVLGKSYATIFDEFDGKHPDGAVDTSGDVKYHQGAEGLREIGGRRIALSLVPNPSHLEFVNAVLEGVARAKQRGPDGGHDEVSVVPVCVHGDAAFAGEGIVAETMNLSLLDGFRTGGTVHIIVNNQVGFTTDPRDARSTRYASDPAKGYDIPIIHVNGDDPLSCVQAVRLAIAYRSTFHKDVLIDLVSYRRHGHNETDEPAFTQPTLYAKIRAHKTPREVWGARLVAEGTVTADQAQAIEREIMSKLERVQAEDRSSPQAPVLSPVASPAVTPGMLVSADQLRTLNEALLRWPGDFTPNKKVERTLLRRRDALGDAGGIDWGHAEALAFGSLLLDGTSVRLTGQDVERGTFSHRQDVLHDAESGTKYTPLAHLDSARGRMEIYNSPLSETAVMGFEYGYSVTVSDTLVLWEAQYGDFANVAQTVVDQFIASGRAKWGQDSSLTLLLPHGYEGGGPEHSSARLERYLQLSAEDNLRVAYPSTPAQYFHILRRQALAHERRPLVLMQPKSLLRLPEAASKLAELASGTFQPVIDDAAVANHRETVKRIVFCTGKIYYDLTEKRKRDGGEGAGAGVALVRVEELYPWPHDDVARVVDSYPAIEDVVWAQEEPKNMGAWTFVWPRLRVSTGNAIPVRYIGRSERASTAEGYAEPHKAEQERIVSEVFALPQPAQGGRARASVR
ncbi:MAG: 2-oxoglutarate dehydrogenase E1 component [Gemmatimonadota bacterium]|nr:2-oxoglutarate dehydrogenase E1 component [Gemmatimonadota bacterium]